MTGLKTDKDMGNFWAWFWHVAFWEATEALGLVGKEDFEQERFLHHLHPLPQGWNPVNKKLFPLTLIVGSFIKRHITEPWFAQLLNDWTHCISTK